MAIFSGHNVRIINDSIRPELRMGEMKWIELDVRNWDVDDRGASRDVYESKFSVRGRRDELEELINFMDSQGREQTTLVLGAGESLFGPEISAINAAILEYPDHVRESFQRWSAMDIRMRALDPVSSGTADFTKLKMASHSYTPNTDFRISKHFAYDPTVVNFADRRADGGMFKGVFEQTDAEMIGIRRYITTVARGGVITFPNIQGITYPWGPRGPSSGGNCRIRFFGNERRIGLRWQFEMHFVREY